MSYTTGIEIKNKKEEEDTLTLNQFLRFVKSYVDSVKSMSKNFEDFVDRFEEFSGLEVMHPDVFKKIYWDEVFE